MGFVALDSFKKLYETGMRLKRQIALLPAGTPLPFDQDLWDDFLAKFDIFAAEYEEYVVASSKEKGFTDVLVLKQFKLKKLCSHFVRVFNMMVDRDAAPKSDRELLKLPTETEEVPYMGNVNALLGVSNNLKVGEPNRVAAGHTPMSNPSIAEVNAASTDFETTLALRDAQTRNVKDESADVESPYILCEEAIMELVNNVRYRLRKRPFSEVRDVLRSLGFQFTPEPGEVFEKEYTIHADDHLEVAEAPIGGTAKAFITLLTNATGVVANIDGGEVGNPLTFNTTLEATFESLGGAADGSGSVHLYNGSVGEVTVRVRVVG